MWYLSREGFSAFGIDGSKTAIERTGEKLDRESLKANLLLGDFQNLPYDSDFFDAVLDITSIQHNDDASIMKTAKDPRFQESIVDILSDSGKLEENVDGQINL